MKCPNCGGEVGPEEVFCGNCGTRMVPPEPAPGPPAPAQQRGLPVIPIVIGAIVLALVGCLCAVLAGVAGLCALVPTTEPTPTRGTWLTPRPPIPGQTAVVVTRAPATPVKSPTVVSDGGEIWTIRYVYRVSALSNTAVEIMGEAVNTSAKEVNTGWVEVLVTLKDKNGKVVPTSKDLTTRLQRPIVKPGQKSCFRYFFTAKDYGFDLTSVDQMEAVVRPAAVGRDALSLELAVSNVKREGNTITGDITNNTRFATSSVFILVSLYDASGTITGVHYGTVVGSEKMKPGDQISFTYNVTSSDVANSFDVLVIAYKE